MRSRFSILPCSYLCLYFIVLTVPSVNRYGAAKASTAYNNKGESTTNRQRSVTIGKCCELEELFVDDTCTPIGETNETRWKPEFVTEKGDGTVSRGGKAPPYQLKIGLPHCENNERQWKVYHHSSGQDRLAIVLPSGHLRHYTADLATEAEEWAVLNAMDDDEVQGKFIHLDYAFGHYCIDKVVLTRDHLVASYAIVCVPEVAIKWTDTGYLMRHVVDPVFHAISIASYLIVAIVYFVLPQLRDLVGNMITTMTLCLITSQCASIVSAFTEFGNHFNFLIADFINYISLLAAFFWLNALGYYVWNTFRSRNVFLRVTDGKKYCYYSTYVWGSTLAIAATAIFAHVALETEPVVVKSAGSSQSTQEIIGWLGLSVLFMSIAFTIAVDLCFVLTTANRIKRMNTYGRIHHKMKYSFKMFVFLYTIMSFGWLSILFSRLQLETLVYWNIVVNLLQALFVLYVCVFGQRRVTFLLSKTCNCCNSGDNTEGLDWGEEMTAINAGY